MADLNRILSNYSLIDKEYSFSNSEEQIIDENPPIVKEDWDKSTFSNIKNDIKRHLAKFQRRRCAYCRKTVNVVGKGVPTDHIVPKNLKPTWMFIPSNLCLSCWGCNSKKKDKDPLRSGGNSYGNELTQYPLQSDEYFIFHPYIDNWGDHFVVEDGFFLVPIRDTKGPYTYKELGMNRLDVVLDHKEQLNLNEHSSFRTIVKRMRKVYDPERKEVLERVKDWIIDIIDEN